MLRPVTAALAALACFPALGASADQPAEAPKAPGGAAAPAVAPAAEPATAAAPGPELDLAEALRLARADIDALALGAVRVAPASIEVRSELAVTSSLPASLTSEVPASGGERPERAPAEWLTGVALPDFPVRWNDRLIEVLEYYRSDPRGRAHIAGWLQRSGRYDAMIRRALRDGGLPEDLIYVAMVESGFNPNVVSSASAVGLWQFTASTGRDYGLTYDRWLDERRSPERATEAAVRFLGDLHEDLGSWPLALAAFNMGHAALRRSIGKYNTNDFWVLSRLEAGLPYETIAYVHKITACAIVGRNLERFGFTKLARDAAIDPARVNVPGGTGLGRIAHAAGMSAEDLAALNPELRRGRVPPDVREWAVRIPRERMARFQKTWPSLRAARPSHAEHVLRFGERLRDVADMYGTSLEKLRLLNDLGPDEAVEPGARLRVPDVEPTPPAKAEGPLSVGVPARRFDYPDRRHVFYRVLGRESLEQIAVFFHVEVDDLQRWNDVSRAASLPEGIVLQLFVPKSVDLGRAIVLRPEEVRTVVVGSERFFDDYEANQGRRRVRYRVRAGDTLSAIAKRFDLSIGSVARINGFSPSTELPTGTEIIVYAPADTGNARTSRRD